MLGIFLTTLLSHLYHFFYPPAVNGLTIFYDIKSLAATACRKLLLIVHNYISMLLSIFITLRRPNSRNSRRGSLGSKMWSRRKVHWLQSSLSRTDYIELARESMVMARNYGKKKPLYVKIANMDGSFKTKMSTHVGKLMEDPSPPHIQKSDMHSEISANTTKKFFVSELLGGISQSAAKGNAVTMPLSGIQSLATTVFDLPRKDIFRHIKLVVVAKKCMWRLMKIMLRNRGPLVCDPTDITLSKKCWEREL